MRRWVQSTLTPLPLLFVVALASPFTARAQEEVRTIEGRHVTLWRPKDWQHGKKPLLIFSHGYGGCGTQSRFLTAGLAERGYWVFAPDHKDARCGSGRGLLSRPDEPFREPEKWSDKTFSDRADDVRAILKWLRGNSEFANLIDFTRVGLMGHSLGGYTVLGLAGAWPSWQLDGVKAVLALSPYAQPFIAHRTLSGIGAPVMYQGGTLDLGITPWIKKNEGGYEGSPAPKYFVSFSRAGHLAWTNLRPEAHAVILEYAVAFLDHYLNGVPAVRVLTSVEPGVAELRYQSELGTRSAGSR